MATSNEYYHSTVTLRPEYHIHYRRDGNVNVRQNIYTLNYGPGGRWFGLEGDIDIDILAERIFASNYVDTATMRRAITKWQ